MYSIDINCDVGEGIDNEAQLLPLISSCNIACGGHAGNEMTMAKVIRLAKKYRVRVGAHPSYPDRKNFGRLSMSMTQQKLEASIQKQLQVITSIAKKESVRLHHIKAHGALYNDIAKDAVVAKVYLNAISGYKAKVLLYVPYKSEIEELAKQQGFKVKREAFGDRNYNRDLSLVARNLPNALLVNPPEVLVHLLNIVNEKKVKTIKNDMIDLIADTYCIHGDTPSAYEILTYLNKELPLHNVQIDHD